MNNPIFSPVRRQTRKAFTLVESILVVSLIAVVGVAVYHALANGLDVWKRSRAFSSDEDVAIFFDKFERDLHNAFRYRTLPFKGEAKSITFPTIVHVPVDPKHPTWNREEYVDLMGVVEYSYDAAQESLYRRQANYGQATQGKFEEARPLAGRIHSLSFRYYYPSPGEEKGELVDEYEGELPSAVYVALEMQETTGGSRIFTRLVNIPSAGQK